MRAARFAAVIDEPANRDRRPWSLVGPRCDTHGLPTELERLTGPRVLQRLDAGFHGLAAMCDVHTKHRELFVSVAGAEHDRHRPWLTRSTAAMPSANRRG